MAGPSARANISILRVAPPERTTYDIRLSRPLKSAVDAPLDLLNEPADVASRQDRNLDAGPANLLLVWWHNLLEILKKLPSWMLNSFPGPGLTCMVRRIFWINCIGKWEVLKCTSWPFIRCCTLPSTRCDHQMATPQPSLGGTGGTSPMSLESLFVGCRQFGDCVLAPRTALLRSSL
jgi:hypothetical protein